MDDDRIVDLYWSRSEDAIPATAEKYGTFCYCIAKNILYSHEDAEECVSDAYLQAWNAMPPHRPNCLRTFLGKLTRNLSFNRYKHNTVLKRGGGNLPLVLDELSGCVSGSGDPQQALDRKVCVEAIDDFLGALPQRSRSIFLCRHPFLPPPRLRLSNRNTTTSILPVSYWRCTTPRKAAKMRIFPALKA